MNLRLLDQRVDLYELEALALQQALQGYLHELSERATLRRVPLAEALSIKPVCRVLQRLQQLCGGEWLTAARGTRRPVPRARVLRLEYDELLQLLALHQAGELTAMRAPHADALQVCLAKVHQRGQNLGSLFQVR